MEEAAQNLDSAAQQLLQVGELSIDFPGKVEVLPGPEAAQAMLKAPVVHMHAIATALQQPLHRPLSIDTAWARAHGRDWHAAQMVKPSNLQDYLPNRAFTEPERQPLGVSALDLPITQLRANPSGERHLVGNPVTCTVTHAWLDLAILL